MQGGYNIVILVELLDDIELVNIVVEQLKYILLMFDVFYDVVECVKKGNVVVKFVL